MLSGEVTTLAGSGQEGHSDGAGTNAFFWGPDGIAYDSNRNCFYVCDYFNNSIRKLTSSGMDGIEGLDSMSIVIDEI